MRKIIIVVFIFLSLCIVINVSSNPANVDEKLTTRNEEIQLNIQREFKTPVIQEALPPISDEKRKYYFTDDVNDEEDDGERLDYLPTEIEEQVRGIEDNQLDEDDEGEDDDD